MFYKKSLTAGIYAEIVMDLSGKRTLLCWHPLRAAHVLNRRIEPENSMVLGWWHGVAR